MNDALINWQPTNLEDEILKLMPLSEPDFENLFQVASDPLIWEQHPTNDRYKKEVFQLYFDGAISGKTAFLIIDKATGKIIGSTRYYDYNPDNSSIAIGYTFLARQFWGGLYNKSSKKLLIDYAFQFVDNIVFHIGATNIRSQIAMERSGGIKFSEEEITYAGEGKSNLNFLYKILKKDWELR